MCENSLVVQWLGLHALTVEDPNSIPGGGTKFPQAAQCSQKKYYYVKERNLKF